MNPRGSGAPNQGAPDTQESPMPPPEEAVMPTFLYDIITEDRARNWRDGGKEEVKQVIEEIVVSADESSCGQAFQELIEAAATARIDAKDAGELVRNITSSPTVEGVHEEHGINIRPRDLTSLFLDLLSIFAESSTITPNVPIFIEATGLSSDRMRHELESTVLEKMGMIRNTFVRVGIRQQTNLLYRQSNYNLLREETEGYSKLITELFLTSNSEQATTEVIEDAYERVKGTTGAFDLDVGRVLDVTLDVFASVLVKQNRFFVKYLRASSWWPSRGQLEYYLGPLPIWALPNGENQTTSAKDRTSFAEARRVRDVRFWDRCRLIGMKAFFELGDRQVDEQILEQAIRDAKASGQLDTQTWIEETRTLPPAGNKVAAQILGFKLQYYCSNARDATDAFPANLIYLSALLVKIGFVSFRDLYAHLWPEDSAMENVKAEKVKEKAAREKSSRPGGAASNALLAAAPLPDDTVEGQAREINRLKEAESLRRKQRSENSHERSTPVLGPDDKSENLPEPSDQKVQLLKSLLCIGALPEAFYMLGRFPWLVDLVPDLPEYIHRILHHSLSEIYAPLQPLSLETGLQEQLKIPSPDQSGVPKGSIRLVTPTPKRPLRWAQLDLDDTPEGNDYRFYWDEWADLVPVCRSVDDVFTLCSSLGNLVGFKIGQDPSLLLKFARIGKHSLDTDDSPANSQRWLELTKRLLVPALSLTKCNPGVVNEMYTLLKYFSESVRYNIYGEWYYGQTSRIPDIQAAFNQTKAETRDVLKRISKTTIKPMARALAKIAYASPGVVFSVAISQLESYDNIVDTFVECGRYFTYLAYDVLTWSLMSALGSGGRNRVQADGMLTSKWLAALSLFAGKVFKRYSVMNPLPIVQYVAHELRNGNATDLLVLENITRSMAGIISDSSFNESQIIAMGGGELLQAHTLQQLHDRRHEAKSTARRLIRPLTESYVVGQLMISLAQERQMCIFRVDEADAHPKLLGNVFDQIHRVLGQYIDLTRSNLSVEDFNECIPDVVHLIADFGVEPNVAFWIARPSINAAMVEHDSREAMKLAESESTSSAIVKPVDNDTALATSLEDVTQTDVAVEVDAMDVDTKPEPLAEDTASKSSEVLPSTVEVSDHAQGPRIEQSGAIQEVLACHPVLESIAKSLQDSLPATCWQSLRPAFFVTFWQLSLGDVFTSLDPYHEAQKRLEKKIKAISDDRSDVSVTGHQRKSKEKQVLMDQMSLLHKEMKDCMQANLACKSRLRKEKDRWFMGSERQFESVNVALIEYCILPRLVLSPLDAMYTFKMIKLLHSENVLNFHTMGLYDQLFTEKRVKSLIFLCSAKEAENLGRFLNDLLRDLGSWHADRSVFEREAYGTKRNLTGFARRLSRDNQVEMFYEYEEFRRILLKWHRNLNNALKSCYASGEYMHIRNSINILNSVYQNFPAINWMGNNQLQAITELSKREDREDLKIAATSLIGALKRREKQWIMPQAFNLIEGVQTATNGTEKKSHADTANALNPEAADFRPSDDQRVGDAEKISDGIPGDEDGEIQDNQMVIGADDAVENPSTSINPEKPAGTSTAGVLDSAVDAKSLGKAGATPVEHVKSSVPFNVAGTNQDASPNLKPIPSRPEANRASAPSLRPGHANLPDKPETSAHRKDTQHGRRNDDRSNLSWSSHTDRDQKADVGDHSRINDQQRSNDIRGVSHQSASDNRRNPDRKFTSSPASVPAHPDRAALIQGHGASRDGQSSKSNSQTRNDPTSRHAPTAPSSKPSELHKPHSTNLESKNVNAERLHLRNDRDKQIPTQPSSDRTRFAGSGERQRDTRVHAPFSSSEESRGRFQAGNRQSETYGRLNAESEHSGRPRSPESKASRSRNNASITTDQSASTSQDARSRNTTVDDRPLQAPNGPSTKTVDTAVGIHPDRLAAIQLSQPHLRPSQTQSANPALSTATTTSSRSHGSTSQLPTGPADKGQSSRHLTNMQTTLSQSTRSRNTDLDDSGQGTSIRGRGGRASLDAGAGSSASSNQARNTTQVDQTGNIGSELGNVHPSRTHITGSALPRDDLFSRSSNKPSISSRTPSSQYNSTQTSMSQPSSTKRSRSIDYNDRTDLRARPSSRRDDDSSLPRRRSRSPAPRSISYAGDGASSNYDRDRSDNHSRSQSQRDIPSSSRDQTWNRNAGQTAPLRPSTLSSDMRSTNRGPPASNDHRMPSSRGADDSSPHFSSMHPERTHAADLRNRITTNNNNNPNDRGPDAGPSGPRSNSQNLDSYRGDRRLEGRNRDVGGPPRKRGRPDDLARGPSDFGSNGRGGEGRGRPPHDGDGGKRPRR